MIITTFIVVLLLANKKENNNNMNNTENINIIMIQKDYIKHNYIVLPCHLIIHCYIF